MYNFGWTSLIKIFAYIKFYLDFFLRGNKHFKKEKERTSPKCLIFQKVYERAHFIPTFLKLGITIKKFYCSLKQESDIFVLILL